MKEEKNPVAKSKSLKNFNKNQKIGAALSTIIALLFYE